MKDALVERFFKVPPNTLCVCTYSNGVLMYRGTHRYSHSFKVRPYTYHVLEGVILMDHQVVFPLPTPTLSDVL